MIRKIAKLGVVLHLGLQGIQDKFWAFFYKKRFASCGSNIMIKPCTSNFKGFENIHLASNIRIARFATIYATNAKVFIGNHVGAAPYLSIMTGNHSIDHIGAFMFNLTTNDKKEGEDKDVVLEDDLWIGIHVTILSGVRIGRGSILGAGSVVNKSVPPYSVVGGVPAKVLKFRMSIDQIIEHEKLMYSSELRFTREELENQRKNYQPKR